MAEQDRDLSRRIEELEALLASRGQSDMAGDDIEIPVLDELVEPDAATAEAAENLPASERETIPADAPTGAPDSKALEELAARLEEKFSRELDATVRIIKDNLRQSIVEELHTELDPATGRQTPPGDRD